MLRKTWVVVLAIGGLLALLPSDGRAQATTAGLHGTVRDQTGAVLPGATVTARNLESGRERTAQTDPAGRYLFTQLPIGAYELKAELSGFQQQIRRGVELAVGEDAAVDFSLAVGEVNQSVVITAEAPLVETTGSSICGMLPTGPIPVMATPPEEPRPTHSPILSSAEWRTSPWRTTGSIPT